METESEPSLQSFDFPGSVIVLEQLAEGFFRNYVFFKFFMFRRSSSSAFPECLREVAWYMASLDDESPKR